ncbi:MAG: DUF72 domain-containing protein [Balneolaceae bacterium]|nr:DUF72 domain-containing protein [Balneolaceae bacterium]
MNEMILPYHLGCSVWALPEWVGSFFRDDAKAADFLTQYASVFNTVEGNTTFYNIPSPGQIESWNKKTPRGFKFCFKFPRHITHKKQLMETDDDALRFVELFTPLREKLGPFMIQLPPAFSANDISRLENLLSILPKDLNYSVEVRHKDFFDHGRHERNFVSLLQSYNIDRVIFDSRKLHSVKSQAASILEAQKKKPKVPIRFDNTHNRPLVRYVGTNDILNNEPYLKEWAIIVAEWIKEGLHPYIFIHSPNKVDQPKLCRHFHQLLSKLIEIPPLPQWPIDKQGKQLGLF